MVASFFCCGRPCCSQRPGSNRRRQQYRYEVVYRREESLYSGPDYLESLPGGRKESFTSEIAGSPSEGRPRKLPLPIRNRGYIKQFTNEEDLQCEKPLQTIPTPSQRCPLPLSTPLGADSLCRQNRVNHYLTTLHPSPPQRFSRLPPPGVGRPPLPPHHHPWKSTPYLLGANSSEVVPPIPTAPNLRPWAPSYRGGRPSFWPHARSAPALYHPFNAGASSVPAGGIPAAPVGDLSHDQSISSRDASREHSLASSSANSTRPLICRGHPEFKKAPLLVPISSAKAFQTSAAEAVRCHVPPSRVTFDSYRHSAAIPPPASPYSHTYQYPRPPPPPPPPPGTLTRDLRSYLSTRFPKGSVDHEHQTTIRDNVYLRTVPVTTRPPRQGEVNGVDYTFLSYEEFLALQRSGSLLEAGVFEGNHYGTPKPPLQGDIQRSQSGAFYPGAHPSSEGKRRRNRSNVEAMAANSVAPGDSLLEVNEDLNQSFSGANPNVSEEGGLEGSHQNPDPNQDLGPLPPNWEQAFTENGEPYFIDHIAGTSSWLDPRLARIQKRNAEDCGDNELPYGWERIDDPQYGTYYIDHVNRKTQYENPVVMARKQIEEVPQPDPSPLQNTYRRTPPTAAPPPLSTTFTKNPSELSGEFIHTTLIKSSRGLGFTIVGGDDNEEEFLQIKSVVPNGPAWQDGKLRTGDVLVYVNDTCVLGYTHADVVNMFQNIEPSCTVHLEVCRGYPLPFDPNDPNTEIVTTVAVTNSDLRNSKSLFGGDFEGGRQSRNSSSESMNTAKSMPDLSKTERIQQVPRPGSADLLSSENFDPVSDNNDIYPSNHSKPEYLTIPIVKGNLGFGFTIADSAYGQKVKKILDRSRCKNLCEGDILVDINNINVKGMNHTEVVQVLKECSQGQEAIVMVQRGSFGSPLVSQRGSRKNPPPPSPKKSNSNFGMYRSKTPTADMYSSQQKEVIPNRPKTPLVDTRNCNNNANSFPHSSNSLDKTDNRHNQSHEYIPQYHNSTHPPFPGAFSYTGAGRLDPSFDNNINNITNELSHASMNGNSYESYVNSKYPKYSEDKKEFQQGKYYPPRSSQEKENYPMPHHENDKGGPYMKNAQKIHNSQYSYYNEREDPRNYPNNNFDSSGHQFSHLDQNLGYNYTTYNKDSYDIPRQDSGYSSQAQIPPSKNPFPPYYGQNSSVVAYSSPSPLSGYRQGDLRKESTSFESEHPASVSTSRMGNINTGHMGTGVHPNLQNPYHEFYVTLHRQEKGFGFRIVGGTEEGSQVSIGLIVPGGAADQEGTIMNGDEIVGVDGQLVVGSSHHEVVELMAAAASRGRVTLHLRRPKHEISSMEQHHDLHLRTLEGGGQYPYDITVNRRENEGFGFIIISSATKSGSTIGKIIEGSPAERSGKLNVGDRILKVNAIDIKRLPHGDIVNLIKESGYSVTLTIGAPRDDVSSSASNSQRGESEIGDEGDLYHVQLQRGVRGFGFSIRGGKEFHNMPLFVLRIAENGPASQDGKLMVGDQLIEINGVPTRDMTHAEAIELIKQCGSAVSLLMKRGNKFVPNIDAVPLPNSLSSPVGPPPPGIYVRSSATLPSGSPITMSHPANPSYYSYNPPTNPNSSYSHFYHTNSSSNPPPPTAHAPPSEATYPMPINPHMTNGPLGQSSPRVPASDGYYWNRVSDGRQA